MDYFIHKKIFGCFLILVGLFIQLLSEAQYQNSGTLYGGKLLSDDQFTLGGRRLNSYQPQYGGKRIDEQSLYNPYLEDAFQYMGKPLYSPNPYSYPRLITPYYYNPKPSENVNYPMSSPRQTSYQPIEEKSLPSNTSNTYQKREKEESSFSTPFIIPTIVASIEALYRGGEFKGTKRLSLSGWYGDIRSSSGNSGNFNLRNTNGESIYGSYSVSGSRISYNITHYDKGKSNLWYGDSSFF